MHIKPGPGTGIKWDEQYANAAGHTEGPHHFNKYDTVQREDGKYGRVISRTALTAEIKWPDGTVDLVPQFDTRFTVCNRHAD